MKIITRLGVVQGSADAPRGGWNSAPTSVRPAAFGCRLAADVIRAVRHGNRREIKVVAESVMLTALALAEHVAEGYGRYTAPEQRQLYRAARRDLLRLETQLAIARQADILSAAHLAQLSNRAQLVARLLGGYLV